MSTQSRWLGTAFRWPSICILFISPGVMMSCRKRSCCSISSARSVGPGWLQSISQRVRGRLTTTYCRNLMYLGSLKYCR
jgi:hypothetical protein